jgi:hypothetical protein
LAGIGFEIVAHVAEDARADGRPGLHTRGANASRARPLLKTMAIRARRQSGRLAKCRRE